MKKGERTNLVKVSDSVYRCNQPTPKGGCYSMAFYSNEKGACAPEDANRVLILEYDENDNVIFSTHGMTMPKREENYE